MSQHEFDSLVPPQGFSRREFLVTSLGAGFALATQPVAAQTAIVTDAEGLLAGEVKVPVSDGELLAYRAAPQGKDKAPVILLISEIFGAHEYIRDTARRLAKLSYFVIAEAVGPLPSAKTFEMKGRDASFGRRAIVIGMSAFALAVDVSAQQELGLGLGGGWSQIAFVQRAHTSIKPNGLGDGFGGRVWFEMGRSVFLTWGLFVARCGIDEHETYPGVLSPSGLAKHTTGTLSRYELEMGLGGTVKRSAKFSLRIFGAVQAIAWTSYAGQYRLSRVARVSRSAVISRVTRAISESSWRAGSCAASRPRSGWGLSRSVRWWCVMALGSMSRRAMNCARAQGAYTVVCLSSNCASIEAVGQNADRTPASGQRGLLARSDRSRGVPMPQFPRARMHAVQP